jgi:hypothetical protein
MLASINVIRQKASCEKICDFKINSDATLFFPREDQNGTLYVVSNEGEIFSFYEGSYEQLYTLNSGNPSCICFDNQGCFYVSENMNNCIFYKNHSIILIINKFSN